MNDKKVSRFLPGFGAVMMTEKEAAKYDSEQGTDNGLDIKIEHDDINELEFELEHGSTNHKVSIMHYMNMAGIASIEDEDGKQQATSDNIARAQLADIELAKRLQQGDVNGILKNEEVTGYQGEAISKRELKVMDMIYESLTGTTTGLGKYLSQSHEQSLAKVLEDRNKQSFLYQVAMQYASILKTAGITDEENIREVLDAKLGTDFGFFKSNVSYVRKIDGCREVGEAKQTVDVAETLADMIKKGDAIDMQVIHLDTGADLEKIANALNNNPVFNSLLSIRAARALEQGEDSAYAKVWASSLASLTGLSVNDSTELLYGIKEKKDKDTKVVVREATTGLGQRYAEFSKRASDAVTGMKYDPEIKETVSGLVANPVLNKFAGKDIHPEQQALLEDYVSLMGIDDAEAKRSLVSGTQTMGWRQIEGHGTRYNKVKGNTVHVLEAMYKFGEPILASFNDTTSSGDDGLARTLTLMELERKSKVEGDERVSQFAEQVGKKMSASESKAEKEFIDAFGSSFGFPDDMKKEACDFYNERQSFKNGAYAAVMQVYTKEEAAITAESEYAYLPNDEDQAKFEQLNPEEQEILKSIRAKELTGQPKPESRANSLAKSMEAAVLIAMDVKDHYDADEHGEKVSLEDCMVEVIGSMGGMIGLPVDDQTNLFRKFTKKGEMGELVSKLIKFKDIYAETKALKDRDAYGLISADVEFARGMANQLDLNHVWGTMHLYAMAAKAAYCEGERTTTAPGAKHMDRPDINDGAMLNKHLDPVLKHVYTDKRQDITKYQSERFAKELKTAVVERDELISQVIDDLATNGAVNMTNEKYRKIADERMPEGLPVEVVRLFSSMQSLYSTILKDGKYEAEEGYLLTQALPMIGVRNPEMIDKIAGVSFPGSMEVQRDNHGRIGMLDQGLIYMNRLSGSEQYKNVMKALEFAGATDLQKAE